jgi:pimeloyl-ACP methyl ester carboxylesterase
MDTEMEFGRPEPGAGDRGAGMKHFITSDGLRLAYQDEGAGVPVLCLHGLSRTGEDFDPIAESFRSQARIIRLDLRGRGASEHDKDFMNYNILVEGRDAIELLDHLGLERATIFGTSRGGMIALTLAAAARDRLAGVIFNDIGPHVEPAGLARIMQMLGLAPNAATLDEYAATVAEQLSSSFPGVGVAKWRWFLSHNYRETPDGVQIGYDPRLREAVLTQMEGGEMPDLWPIFDRLEGLPLLLLRGENSDILSAATAEAMCTRRPDMAYVVVRDRGHVPFLDEPECQQAVGAFIGGLSS